MTLVEPGLGSQALPREHLAASPDPLPTAWQRLPTGGSDHGPAYLRLRQLVVVVGEAEVEAPSVDVHRGSQEGARHG